MDKSAECNTDEKSVFPVVACGDIDVEEPPYAGISKRNWDRFRELKRRREQQCQRSTKRRIDDIKSTLVAKIRDEFTNVDELNALCQHNVDLASLSSETKRQKNSGRASEMDLLKAATAEKVCDNKEGVNTVPSEEWQSIKQYLDINSHLTEKTGGSDMPHSQLELTINRAVALQEYDTAEQLSDRLAMRDFGTKIAEAFDAKQFTEKRKHEEMMKEMAKKKRLVWGFEHKRRWETKGNM
jgi:hypothetical protein